VASQREDLIIGLKAEQGNMISMLDKLSKSFHNLEKDVEKLSGETVKAGNKMEKAFSKAAGGIKRMAGRMIAMLGAGGLIGVIYKAVGAANSFETALAEVSTLLGKDAPAQMEKYRSSIMALAKDSSASVDELTSALYQTISAGVEGSTSVAGAMKLVSTAQKAAVAGVSDTFSAVDVLTTALNSYNKSTESAMEFSDKLFTAVKLGKINFTQLAQGLGVVASVAASSGVSFSELNASLAAMTKGGVMPARAFTSLNAIIKAFTTENKELTKALGESATTILRRDGLIGVLEKLNEVTKGDAIEMRKLIKEQEAMTGIAVLAGTGIDNMRFALEEMEKSSGATETAYKKMSDTFAQKTAKFKNQVNDIFIKIGNKILPILMEKMEGVGKWVDENQEKIVSFLISAIDAVVGFGEWIIENGPVIVTVLTSIFITTKIVSWVAAIGKASAAVKIFGLSAKVAAGLFGLLASAVTFAVATRGGLQEWFKDAAANKEWDNLVDRINTKLAFQFTILNRMQQKFKDAFDEMTFGTSEFVPEGETEAEKKAKEILSKEEEKKRKAALKKRLAEQKKADAMLKALRIADMSELQKLEQKYADDYIKFQKANYKNESDRDKAFALLDKKFAKDKEKLLVKLRDIQIKTDEKHLKELQKAYKIEKEIKDFQDKYLEDQKTKSEEAYQRYRDMRAEWTAMAQQKWLEPGIKRKKEEEESRIKAQIEYDESQFSGVKEFFNQFTFEGLKESVDNFATSFLYRIQDGLLQIAQTSGELFVKPLNQITDILLAVLSGAGAGQVEDMVGQAVTFWENMVNNLDPILAYLAEEGVPRIINAAVNAIPTIISAIMTHVPRIIAQLAGAIPLIITAFVNGLPEIISGIIGMIPMVINAFIAGIPQIIFAFVKQIPMIAMALAKAVVEAVLNMVSLGAFGKKKGGGKGGILPGIGKGKGTEQEPIVTTEQKKEELAKKGFNITHVAAMKSHYRESLFGGPNEGESNEEYKERLARMKHYLEMAGEMHQGGMVRRAVNAASRIGSAIKAHAGMFIGPSLAADEVPIIGRIGESILNPNATAAIGGEKGVNALNSGQGVGDTHYHMEWRPQHAFVEESGRVIDRMQSELIRQKVGGVYKTINKNAVPGFKTRK